VPVGLIKTEKGMGFGLGATKRGGDGVWSCSAGVEGGMPCYKRQRGPDERRASGASGVRQRVTTDLIEREKKLGAWAAVAVSYWAG
jgi:hypothetical protein